MKGFFFSYLDLFFELKKNKIITKQTQAYKDKANILLLILSKSSGLIVFTHNGIYVDRKQFFLVNNGATINSFSATSLPYLTVNQDISLIKTSWPISVFTQEDIPRHGLALIHPTTPWPEDLGLSPGLCLSGRFPCAAVPGHRAFVSPEGISTCWAVGLMGTSFKI